MDCARLAMARHRPMAAWPCGWDRRHAAIGQLCARNPFPIVVPCHRILTTGGARDNYSAGGGVTTKRWLLDHETRHGAKP